MDIADQYHDYLAIRQLRAPIPTRIRILSTLMSVNRGWKVIGITRAALEVFAQHNFKKVSHMGINRSHIIPRATTYTRMISEPALPMHDWWDLYITSDNTILATASENVTDRWSEVIPIDPDSDLFRGLNIGWRHNKQEIAFLRSIYETPDAATI
jgi:hypothetical protein